MCPHCPPLNPPLTGSVLGPVLLSLYIRHIPAIIAAESVHCQQFADGIMLDVSGESVNTINTQLSNAVTKLSAYLNCFGLILKESKTMPCIYLLQGHQQSSRRRFAAQ